MALDSYPVHRSESRIDRRDALQAGRIDPAEPTTTATSRTARATSGVKLTFSEANALALFRTRAHRASAATRPENPPSNARQTDSPDIIQRMAPGVKPRAFMMPTSRARSRTGMGIGVA